MRRAGRTGSWILCFLLFAGCFSACSGGLFEMPPDKPSPVQTEKAVETEGEAVSDTSWNALASGFAALKESTNALHTVYEESRLPNGQVEELLAQADALLDMVGTAKRSELKEEDAAELQELMTAVKQAVDDMYGVVETVLKGQEAVEKAPTVQKEAPKETNRPEKKPRSSVEDEKEALNAQPPEGAAETRKEAPQNEPQQKNGGND